MSDSKPFDWSAKPESLEAKFKLMCRLPYDPRARRRHVMVYGFILDWYHSKYGDALASVRHVHRMVQERDPAGRGLYIGEIHGALADLVSWGYLSRDKGKGRRASRYVPIWTVLEPSVQEIQNANDNDRSVLKSPNTSVLDSPNTTACSVLKSLNEDPSTLTRVKDPGTGMDELDCGAATPPPVDALSGTTAGSPQEARDTVPAEPTKWFDHLYGVYGVRKGKAAARRAFEKIAPDLPAFTAMVDAARGWRSAAGGIDRKWLATWLTDECFDEEPSGPRVERPAKAKATKPTTSTKPTAPGSEIRHFTIVAHTTDGSPFSDYFESFTFRSEDGEEFTRRMHVLKDGAMQSDEAPDYDAKLWLCSAAFGRGNPEGKYVGRVIGISEEKGEQIFWHLPDENPPPVDDEPEPEPEPLVAPPSEPLTESEVAEIKARVDALPAMPTAAESPKAFAARMARTFNDPWPEWLGDDVA